MTSVGDSPRLGSPDDQAAVRSSSDMMGRSLLSENPDTTGTLPQSHAWWFVWCHEQCHRPESYEKLQQLDNAAASAGAALLTVRKADSLAKWCAQARRLPYALLTDWREAKLCCFLIGNMQPKDRPLFTVVLCDEPEPENYTHATAWARARSARDGLVCVCRDMGFLMAYFERLASGGSLT
eukprot:CAMPEP_0204512174 /NCGR_PEP_ID=MMETSP0661-20131031/824_1 /ASSEMBLY_ACC=CAM_ASM_000606 /TAXON_ID=109239 /ORGANISM="Alexandrium margalefi, Strain AMGDE01CS-322" /LENGTH=180 /DNA_ID=CAMNT_0051517289 /DNA_START=30 /DNA_END=568 /DNA_ORIENTATION=-